MYPYIYIYMYIHMYVYIYIHIHIYSAELSLFDAHQLLFDHSAAWSQIRALRGLSDRQPPRGVAALRSAARPGDGGSGVWLPKGSTLAPTNLAPVKKLPGRQNVLLKGPPLSCYVSGKEGNLTPPDAACAGFQGVFGMVSISILSRDPSFQEAIKNPGKPTFPGLPSPCPFFPGIRISFQETIKNLDKKPVLKRTMVENNGESTPRLVAPSHPVP